MPNETGPYQSTEEPRSGEEHSAYLDQALWQGLVDAGTDEEFCSSWLGIQSGMITGVLGGMVVLGAADKGPFAPAAFWPEQLGETGNLARVTERCLKERKGVVLKAEPDNGETSPENDSLLVAYPLRFKENSTGRPRWRLRPVPTRPSSMPCVNCSGAWHGSSTGCFKNEIEGDAGFQERLTTSSILPQASCRKNGSGPQRLPSRPFSPRNSAVTGSALDF